MPALGLGRVDLALPDADALGALGERLRHHGFEVRDDGRALSFDDPWNNLLVAAVGLSASDAVADDELRLEDRHVARVAAGEQVEQHARHPLALREGRLTHRRQLRDDGCRDRRVVEAHDRDVVRNPDARAAPSTASAPRAMRSLATKIASGRSPLLEDAPHRVGAAVGREVRRPRSRPRAVRAAASASR